MHLLEVTRLALLTDVEMDMGPQAWATFYDPLPSWSGEFAQTQDAD